MSSIRVPFLVSLAAVPECQPHADAHESKRREQEYKYASADGPLTVLGGARGIGVAHGAALRKRRHRAEGQDAGEHEETKSHFTPSFKMRSASGKKKIHISAKHAQTEMVSSQRIVRISDFRCMK